MKRSVVVILLVVFLAGVGVSVVGRDVAPVGSFPDREPLEGLESYRHALEVYEGRQPGEFSPGAVEAIVGVRPENFGRESISTSFLDNTVGGVPAAYDRGGVGAANVVTGILWDYRGYDTLGEATVIFAAVAGVGALFRGFGKEEEEDE